MNRKSEQLGPWIAHDGKGFPFEIVKEAWNKGARRMIRSHATEGRTLTPWEQANPDEMDKNSPSWTWRRKYLLFGPWIASDPSYSRVIRYRFVFPQKAITKKSASAEMLRDIAAGKRDPIAEPSQKEIAQ